MTEMSFADEKEGWDGKSVGLEDGKSPKEKIEGNEVGQEVKNIIAVTWILKVMMKNVANHTEVIRTPSLYSTCYFLLYRIMANMNEATEKSSALSPQLWLLGF